MPRKFISPSPKFLTSLKTNGSGLSSGQLNGFLGHRYAGFQGAVPVDRLPERLKDGQSVIVNLQESGESGSHWVVVSCQKGQCLYVDPFGGPADDRVLAMMRRSEGTPMMSTNQYQDPKSDACGLFCCVIVMEHGKMSLYDLLYKHLQPDRLAWNDKKVRRLLA